MAPLLSVVIPTYNEAANIGPLLGELRRVMAGLEVEFIVVDDDSRDGTSEKARLAEPRARIIVRKGERGLATAVVRGIREAHGTFVAVMDADFQHPPAAVRAMLDRAVRTQADLVVGSRYAPGGSQGNFGAVRSTISKGARLIAKTALPPIRNFKLTDPMSGLFLVRRDRVDAGALRPTGYKILLEILGKADLRRVEEVGYRFQDRRGGASKLGGGVMLQFLVHVLGLGLTHPENQRILRFMLVGASGIVVNLGVLFVLHGLFGIEVTPAFASAAGLSILTNFLLNDAFTFRDRAKAPWIARLGMFFLVSLGGMLTTFAALFVLYYLIGMNYLVADGLAIVAGFAVNYAGNLGFTYGTKRPAARDWVPIVVLIVASGGLYFSALDSVEGIYFDESYYLVVAHQMDSGMWEDPCLHDAKGLDPAPLNYEHPPLAKLIMYASVHAYDSYHGVFLGCRMPDNDNPAVRPAICFTDPEGHTSATYDDANERISKGDKFDNGPTCYHAWSHEMRYRGNAFAWRGPSAVMGVVTVTFIALAARRLFQSNLAGMLAGSFVLLDNLVLTSSRIALLDIFAAGFTAMAVYFATSPTKKGIVATTIFLGLGFSCKFYVLFAGPPILLLSLWIHHRAGLLRMGRFTLHMLAYPLIPLGVFVATYLPWLIRWSQSHNIGWAVGHFFAVNAAAISWDTTGLQTHTYLSPPSEWLSMTTPMNYIHAATNYDVSDGTHYTLYRDIYAMGNPALWWGATAAVVAILCLVAYRLARAAMPRPIQAPVPTSPARLGAVSLPSPPRPMDAQRPVVIPGAPPLARAMAPAPRALQPLDARAQIAGGLGLLASFLLVLVGLATLRILPAALTFSAGGLAFGILAFVLAVAQTASSIALFGRGHAATPMQIVVAMATFLVTIAFMVPSGQGIDLILGLLLALDVAVLALLALRDFVRLPPATQALLLGALVPMMTFLGFFALLKGGRSMFIFYMTEVAPLMALVLGGAVAHLWRRVRWGKPAALATIALVAFAFVWFLPVTIYLELPREGFRWMDLPIPGTGISIPYPGIGFHDIMGLVPWMHECGAGGACVP
ncbi:MAG: glycosyltransferase [bacterium]